MGTLSLKEQSLFSHTIMHSVIKCLSFFLLRNLPRLLWQFNNSISTSCSFVDCVRLDVAAGFMLKVVFGSLSPSCSTFTSSVLGLFPIFFFFSRYSDLHSLPAVDLNFFFYHQCRLWSSLKHPPTKLSSCHTCILWDFPKRNVLNVGFVAFYFLITIHFRCHGNCRWRKLCAYLLMVCSSGWMEWRCDVKTLCGKGTPCTCPSTYEWSRNRELTNSLVSRWGVLPFHFKAGNESQFKQYFFTRCIRLLGVRMYILPCKKYKNHRQKKKSMN